MNILLIPDGARRWAVRNNLGFDDGYKAGAKRLAEAFELLHSRGLKEVWVAACTVKNLSRPPEQVQSFLGRFLQVQDFTKVTLGFDIAGDLAALPEPFKTKYKKLPKPGGADSPVTAKQLARKSDIKKQIDLIIRAGKVSRLSAMIPWHSPYAELYFPDKLWPDMAPKDIERALDFYSRQERRQGL